MTSNQLPRDRSLEKGRKRRALIVLVLAILFIGFNIYLAIHLANTNNEVINTILSVSSYVTNISISVGGTLAVLTILYYFIRFGTIESIEAWGMKVFLRQEPEIETILTSYESFIHDFVNSTSIIEKVRAQILMNPGPIDLKSFIEIVLIKYLEDNDLYNPDISYVIMEREAYFAHDDYTIVTLSNCTFSIEIQDIILTSDQQIILDVLICKIYTIIN